MAYVLTIGGTTKTMQSNWTIDETANGRNLFRFQIKSETGSYRPALDQEVLLTEGGVRIFGGNITRVLEAGLAPPKATSILNTVETADFNALADRRLYTNYLLPSGSLKAALQAVVGSIPGATLDAAQVTGPTLPDLTYAEMIVRDVLNDFSVLSGGYLWEVDYNKVLRMYLPGTVAAPFAVTESNRAAVGDVLVEPMRDGYANVVVVRNATQHQSAFDVAAIAAHGYWEAVYTAPDTTTEDACIAMAATILARSLVIRKQVTYHTLGLGLHPGQTQTITFASRDINNTFLLTDVKIRDIGTRNQELDHEVTALEGTTYQTGWQDTWRQMRGVSSTSGTVIAGGAGGGGVTTTHPVYFLGGNGIDAVRSPTPTWIPASGGSTTLGQGAIQIHIDTVTRGSLSATVTARLRVVDAASVQARLYDVSASAACPGTSASVTSATWTTVTFTTTLTAGDHIYELQLLPGTANADVVGTGFLE